MAFLNGRIGPKSLDAFDDVEIRTYVIDRKIVAPDPRTSPSGGQEHTIAAPTLADVDPRSSGDVDMPGTWKTPLAP